MLEHRQITQFLDTVEADYSSLPRASSGFLLNRVSSYFRGQLWFKAGVGRVRQRSSLVVVRLVKAASNEEAGLERGGDKNRKGGMRQCSGKGRGGEGKDRPVREVRRC